MLRIWRVDELAQGDFAALSGDRNPIHVDPIAARRSSYGRVAVHGVHLMLHALDALAVAVPGTPRRIRCAFRHPVGVGDEITTTVNLTGEATAELTIGTDVWVAAELQVDLGDPLPEREARLAPIPDVDPVQHDTASLASARGSIPVAMGVEAATDRFPHLAARIGLVTLAELVSITRLVGMHVPGERSLLSSLDVTTNGSGSSDGDLHYSVRSVDERFSRVVIDIAGPTLTGSVAAFVRPAPVVQRPSTEPPPAAFAGQRWLVVGGSRGLGEAAVLLLAKGSADVRFTFNQGATDAGGVVERAPSTTAFRLDVNHLEAGIGAILEDGWFPTHLAYMATPPIFDGMRGAYSASLYRRLRDVYVERFLELLDRIGTDRLTGVLWPSTVAVEHDVPGLAEYADAKRDGEEACRVLAFEHPALRVVAPRFPRLLTDQTTSFLPVEFGDTTAELLDALRAVGG